MDRLAAAPAAETSLTRRGRMSTVADSVRSEWQGRWLLLLAVAMAAAAGLRGIADPWELGIRGSPSLYADAFVHGFLTEGFRALHFAPAYVFGTEDGNAILWYWHHPPLYYLYLAGVAELIGHHTWSLRLAQLLLFLPAVPLLYALVRHVACPAAAGVTALLFAAMPLVGYFGPMVLPDGAVLAFGLAASWAFVRHLADPRHSLVPVLATYFVATQLDFSGHLYGIAFFLLALGSQDQRRARRALGLLLLVSLASLALVVVQYGTLFGGPGGFLREFRAAVASSQGMPAPGEIAAAIGGWMDIWIGWPHVALALAGIGVGCMRGTQRPGAARSLLCGAALAAPGLLHVITLLPHAVRHDYWPLVGAGGITVLMAPLVGFAVDLVARRPLRHRACGCALLLACAAAIVHGVDVTHDTIEACRVDARLRESEPLIELGGMLQGDALALSSAPISVLGQFTGVPMHGDITTVAALESRLQFCRALSRSLRVAFVMPQGRQGEAPELEAWLTRCVAPREGRWWVVWRLPLRD